MHCAKTVYFYIVTLIVKEIIGHALISYLSHQLVDTPNKRNTGDSTVVEEVL